MSNPQEQGGAGVDNTPPATPPAIHLEQQQAPVDVQAEIAKAVQAERARLKEATGFETVEELQAAKLKAEGKKDELIELHKTEAQRLKTVAVRSALQVACAGSIAPDLMMLKYESQAEIDASGAVTINGKPAADVIAADLKANPHLAKPSGNTGSQSPHNVNGALKTMSRGQFDGLPPAERSKFMRDGGIITD